MKFLKNNKKIIAAFAAGVIITGGVGYAANEYIATNIKYTDNKTVAQALNELYENKKNTSDETKNITSNGNQTLDKYYKNLNVNVTANKTLLWTNPNNLTDNLNGTESITLNSSLSNFSHIMIQWVPSTSNTTVIYEDIFKIKPYRKVSDTTGENVGDYGVGMTHLSGPHVHRSLFYTDDTHMRIGNCVFKAWEDNSAQSDFCIFYKIYGLNLSY